MSRSENSDSFKILPREPRTLDLSGDGSEARYVISPNGRGEKRLRVYARYEDSTSSHEHEEILTLTVIQRPSATFLGLGADARKTLQAIGAAVGVPGLLV